MREEWAAARRGQWRDLSYRVRAEFQELPGLSLRVDQAARLFGIDRIDTECILEMLVRAGFLRYTSSGGFARNDSRP
jgi:hypothetical protein